MLQLSETALRQLIAGGETATVELKRASPRPTEMAERLCGMANAQGGFIIVGVEDIDLSIVGVPNDRIALTTDVILRAARQIEPKLLLDPPEPEIYELDGKRLVVATVPPSAGPIYQSSGVCWVRRGTHTIPLGVSEMLELANDRGLVSWERQPARKATMEDIDMERVKAYLGRRSERSHSSGRLNHLEKALVGMDCATAKSNSELVPTNAGILFFGYEPQQHILQSDVVCVLFRDELGVGRYIDRKNITGTIQELIDEAEAFLNRYIAVGARIEGWKRIDLPEYAIEALRETVVNAVIHRDYSRGGESIRIFYYTDRIEVHSPGLLLPGITVGQMERGEVMSKLRNPVLANLLKDVPGYMERLGSGIRFMLSETKRLGLPAPQFRETSEFVVTFYKAADESMNETRTLPSDGYGQDKTGDSKEVAVSAHVESLDQKGRFALAMRCVHANNSITNREYREMTNISEQTANRDLETLVTQGVLKRVGKTRGRIYKLP
ncbi:MAG: helix-turn-helix domain-containing protein [Ktedonobacteraceae bacterium]